jgi:hypothetical protein
MSHGGTRGAAGGILVRFETRDGLVRWRNVPDLEHRTLCRAGGLCEAITTFDVPRSFAGGSGRGMRRIEGYIFQGPKGSPPIGKITLVEERERFADRDHVEQMRAEGIEVGEATRDGWRSAG